jgi:hypothetical protein
MAHLGAFQQNNPLAFRDRVIPATNKAQYPSWSIALALRDQDVLNGFFLYSLLLDYGERHAILVIPHSGGTQKDRLTAALFDRNKRTEGIGQEHYFHACNLCFKTFEKDGELCEYTCLPVVALEVYGHFSQGSGCGMRWQHHWSSVLQRT